MLTCARRQVEAKLQIEQDPLMDAEMFARQMASGIELAVRVHSAYPNKPSDAVGYQDHLTSTQRSQSGGP